MRAPEIPVQAVRGALILTSPRDVTLRITARAMPTGSMPQWS